MELGIVLGGDSTSCMLCFLRNVFGFGTGECSNKECPFLHIDPESKIKDCPWYDRGFCKHGMYGQSCCFCRYKNEARLLLLYDYHLM